MLKQSLRCYLNQACKLYKFHTLLRCSRTDLCRKDLLRFATLLGISILMIMAALSSIEFCEIIMKNLSYLDQKTRERDISNMTITTIFSLFLWLIFPRNLTQELHFLPATAYLDFSNNRGLHEFPVIKTGSWPLKCDSCKKLYIGQKGRSFGIRFSEYIPKIIDV